MMGGWLFGSSGGGVLAEVGTEASQSLGGVKSGGFIGDWAAARLDSKGSCSSGVRSVDRRVALGVARCWRAFLFAARVDCGLL